ncbi:MAG: hypothetical protein RLZZ127_2055 [Planctomycetota bacterium]|jgi:hypothetical protein
MHRSALALMLLLLVPAVLPGADPALAVRPATTALTATWTQPDAWFAARLPPGWKTSYRSGTLEVVPVGATLAKARFRVMAIGLRSAGGKYRDLEHSIADIVFQVRDEFKGTVGPITDRPWYRGELLVTGRQVRGEQPQGGGRIGLRVVNLPHGAPGIVISMQVTAPVAAFPDADPWLDALIDGLEPRTPPP